ncbi:MAG TPA: selenide, water dikinase SelD [Bacteroidia bacterium]|nr:selenide, water dikinase SelD [Bacteroidia bacterium]
MENSLTESIKLTQLSKGSGCGCKIAPAVLEEILGKSGNREIFPGLLVGNESSDDAAILEIHDGLCLISTTDFFTPIVNNPFDYGRIAAANAISDVYAMGGNPTLALAILGFPVDKLSTEVARQIIAGAKEICKNAGIPLAGGHTIDSQDPIFGLAVNGLVRKENIRKNSTAQNGDLIILTKPIGSGVMSAAHKRGLLSAEDLETVTKIMVRLNKEGSKLGESTDVHAMTDVTGFGLIGHLIEMCEGSSLSAQINVKYIPLIPGVETYINQYIIPDNTYRNWNSFESKVAGVSGPEFISLCDPQTSGGLLVAIQPDKLEQIRSLIKETSSLAEVAVIGRFIPSAEKSVYVQ